MERDLVRERETTRGPEGEKIKETKREKVKEK